MTVYLARRLVLAAILLALVSALAFGLVFLTPGDPAEIILRSRYEGEEPPEEAVAALRQKMGLNDPVALRYARWVRQVATGDFGMSYGTGLPVAGELAERLPRTALLALFALFLCTAVAVPVGVYAARWRGRVVDQVALAGSVTLASAPSFWLGIVLILVFSLGTGLFPVAGDETLLHFFLPALTLAAAMSATAMRVTRTSMVEVLSQDYVRTARARGLSEQTVVFKHALRNALIPVVTVLGLNLRSMLGGVVFVEIVFGFHGLGMMLYEGIRARDYPVVQACVLLAAVVTVVLNLAVDLSYGLIDPTVRLEEES